MMTYRKHILSALSVMLLACTMSGYVAAAKVKLVFAGRYVPESPGGMAFQQAMEDYMKLNPHVEFEYLAEATQAVHLEKLVVMAASNNLPDIVHLYNAWLPEMAENNLLDTMPNDLVAHLKREVHPQALVASEYKGKQMGIPTEFQITGLFYNKTLLNQAGVGSIPATWDEMASVAKRLSTAQLEDGSTRTGLALNVNSWGWTANWYTLSAAYGMKYDSAAADLNLNNPISLKVMELLVQWITEDRWASKNWNTFVQGKAYFGLGFPFWANTLEKNLGANFTEQIGVARMPAGPGGVGAYQYGWGLYVSQRSANRQEAWKFLKWMATQPQYSGLTPIGNLQAMISSMPINRRELQAAAFEKKSAYLGAFLESLPFAVTEAKFPAAEQRQAALAQEIEAATKGQKTPQQALADLASRVTALLAGDKKK